MPLKIKLGADPTAPDIHLGHTVVIRKLRAFQELGHTVVFLIGDFTSLIGDPSGRSTTRPRLTREEINANAETYKTQIFKLLDPEHTVIDFNSRWMDRLGSDGFIRLASHVTVKQILERDDFQKRLAKSAPSRCTSCSTRSSRATTRSRSTRTSRLGGTDQKFNLLVGRNLQREYEQEPQVVITMPLLEGTDGVQKMSKSLGNYIGIDEPPAEMFGKVMSISDQLMWRYYELLTDLTADEIKRHARVRRSGDAQPARLQSRAGQTHHRRLPFGGRRAAPPKTSSTASSGTRKCPTKSKSAPSPSQTWKLPRLLVEVELAPSMAEARRLIEQGGVRVDGERIARTEAEVDVERRPRAARPSRQAPLPARARRDVGRQVVAGQFAP